MRTVNESIINIFWEPHWLLYYFRCVERSFHLKLSHLVCSCKAFNRTDEKSEVRHCHIIVFLPNHNIVKKQTARGLMSDTWMWRTKRRIALGKVAYSFSICQFISLHLFNWLDSVCLKLVRVYIFGSFGFKHLLASHRFVVHKAPSGAILLWTLFKIMADGCQL